MRTQTIEFGVYVLALGFAGLFGWQVWRARNPDWYRGPVTADQWKKVRSDLELKGQERQVDDTQWSFDQTWLDWWRKVETANLLGRPDPKPVDVDVTGPTPPPAPKTYRPLSEIAELRAIVAGEEEARIKIQYKDPNVRDPGVQSATTSVGGITATGPAVAVAGPGTLFQDLRALDGENRLWPPYDDVRFERIDFDTPAAVFRRPDPEGKGDDIRESLALAEVGVNDQHFDLKLIEQINARAIQQSVPGASRVAWTDPGTETKMLQPNVWMISQRDNEVIERDYQRIMSEDVTLDDYEERRSRSKDGKPLRGVSVRNVSPSLARFGVQNGDVLIKVNSEPVTSKANAINVAKKQYERGARTFDLTFLSRGTEVTRSYRVPDKK